MIDQQLRSKGIGASEIAAVIGLDPRRDAFSIWARKLDLIPEPETNVRMRKGKYFEQGIVRWFSDETGTYTLWSDQTVQHPTREWQVCTPDAYEYLDTGLPVLTPANASAGVDAKLVSFDQREGWGDSGTILVPDQYAIQCHWTTSTLDKPWWDIAACIGDELRVYRIHRDPKIEAALLEAGETFWKVNVLGRTQPPVGATQAVADYLKAQFPKQTEAIRVATSDEVELLRQYKAAREEWDRMEKSYTTLENRVKLAIAEAEGLSFGSWKVTYKKVADSMGTDWESVAYKAGEVRCAACQGAGVLPDSLRKIIIEAGEPGAAGGLCGNCGGVGWILPPETRQRIAALAAAHQIVTKAGTRRIHCSFKDR